MMGIAVLALFLLLGVMTAWQLFDRLGTQTRLLTGLVLGFVYVMWLPTLAAFLVGFTVAAEVFGLVAAMGLTALAHIRRPRATPQGLGARKKTEPPVYLTLALVIPFVALAGYLQYTHVLREVDGALHVGQSTYGDLALHLGIATGLRGASFPPEYTLLPGTLLGYPFLFDSVSTTMMLFGTPLAASMIVPGTIAMGLVFWGFLLFAWEIARDSHAAAMAFLLLFLNGGLGFLYVLDGWPSDATALHEMMTGFYRAPTNMPDLNLRWVNVICDMLIPQRTLLGGWMMLMPALIMLSRAIRTEDRFYFVALGVWSGLMPMVHTHSFLALGLLSAGAMALSIPRAQNRGAMAKNFLLYGAIAVLIALPQLVTWTLPQSLGGGSLKRWFNWCNNTGDGLVDGYFWFWIKNVGPVYLLMVPAALTAPKRARPLALGALVIYAVAELFVFQPNIYDNNKLFYVAFIVMLPMVGRYLSLWWDRLHGVRGRALMGAVFACVCLASGVMTIAREWVSDYQLFSREGVAAAQYVDANAPADAVFLTGANHHANAVNALAGRRIVCGTGIYLVYHGIDSGEQRQAVSDMLERPTQSESLFDQYGVDYIYLSGDERMGYDVDTAAISAAYPIWYDEGGVTIYAVSERAQAQIA